MSGRTTYILFLFSIVLSFIVPAVSYSEQLSENRSGKTVILLHGLGRTYKSMDTMEVKLTAKGYYVINIDYPSTKHTIETLANHLDDVIKNCCPDRTEKINFVTHSMGGIIVRYYLSKHSISNLGRVVMLSPPNRGSELVDTLKENFIFQESMGPAAQQLGTGNESLPLKLGPVNFEVGVITGDSTLNPLYSSIIPGEDDGKVSVENAKVEGMTDFLVVPNSHSFIMNSPEVIEQTAYFLEYGCFKQIME